MPTGRRHLVLLGAGHAHLAVLQALRERHPADLAVTLVSPYPFQVYSGMVPGVIARRYPVEACQIPLEPLARAAHVRWLPGRAVAVDAAGRTVEVAAPGGARQSLAWDLLSLDTGGVVERTWLDAHLPGASTHALAVRPIEGFVRLWPQVVALAQARPISLAVIGAGAAGIELVTAAAQRLARDGVAGSRCTLITGGGEVAASYPPGVQARVRRGLERLGITVLREACVGIEAGGVRLGNGATLACDAPLLALGTQAPAWLADSGLALGAHGHVAVNACQQSTSHPAVFAAGDVADRTDQPHPRSGVYAVRAGPALAHNLLAAHDGRPLREHHPPRHTLNLLSCGAGHAIASHGRWSAAGAWAWWWKDRIDRGFVARHTLADPPNAGPSHSTGPSPSPSQLPGPKP